MMKFLLQLNESLSLKFIRLINSGKGLLACGFLFLVNLLGPGFAFGQTSQTFPSTTTWLCPAGVTSVTAECWGGGGAGGGATGNPAAGGGGAGGSYVKTTVAVTPGVTYTITVGTGASGTTGAGAAGGDSWFISAATLLAKGGNGGNLASSGNQTATGATAISSGNIGYTNPFNYYGGAGGTGGASGASGGGGGSSAGTGSNGNAASGVTGGIAVAGGGAGVNGSTASANGTDNTNIGGGGAGAHAGSGANRSGGDGGNGQVKLTYTQPSCPLSTAIAPTTTQSGCPGFTASAITATITLAGTTGTPALLYQWYYNTTNSNTVAGATLVAGATSSSYTATTASIGTRYYFCVGYAANNGCAETNATQSLASNTVQVTVNGSLSGSYFVGPAQAYTTLTAAVAAYNSSCLAGPVTFLLTNNGGTYTAGETFPITISNNLASSVNTLTIKPNTAVTTTISGAVPNDAVIRVLTDYVTIDGSNNGTSSRNLTITNTSVTAPSVVCIGSTGASYVDYVNLENCVTVNGSITSSAIVVSDATTPGNPGYFTNISIQNNDIRKAYIGVYCNANPATGNGNGLLVSSNLLNNSGGNAIGNVGIYVQGVSGGTVTGNNIGNFETATGESDRGIWLALASSNCVVEKNSIHDLIYTGTGGYGAQGIVVSSGLASAGIRVSNNMIYNMRGDGDSYTTYGAYYCPGGIYAFGTGQGGINIYHNSIYLSGNTLNKNNALSFGIALDNNTQANIKDNLVLNNLGRLGGSNIATLGIAAETNNAQFSSLDYNDYFSSATGTGTNALGRIAGTNYTTLAAWKTASAAETNSLNISPLFVSGTDLHLQAPVVNEPLNNLGIAISSVTTDFDGQNRNLITPDMGADEFKGWGSWIGATNSNWSTASNWYDNVLPVSTTNVEVASATFMPVISSSTYAVKNISIMSPGTVTVSSSGILQVGGSMANSGVFDVSDGTVEMNGTSAQTIPAGIFQSNSIKNFIISNTNNVTGVTLAGALDVYRSVTFGGAGRKLSTGGFLTFKSNASGTAWLGPMTVTNSIVGDAGIERYIPNHSKAWQLLSTPITAASTQTVKQAWQEGANTVNGNPSPGFGTMLTSNVTGAASQPYPGFDAYTANGATIKIYNHSTGNYDRLDSTTGPISNPKGYMVLVRGDRSVTTSSASPTATVMRTKGTLHTPANPPVTINVTTPGFESIGNPYASAIDFRSMSFTGGVQPDFFYLWDPKLTTGPYSPYGLGGFQTFSWNIFTSQFDVSPGGGSYAGSNRYIESGLAFLVNAPLSAGTVSFSESSKVSGSNDVNRMILPSESRQLRTNLYVMAGQQAVLVDGNLVQFEHGYSSAVDLKDGIKLVNSGENLGLARDKKTLSVERRPIIEDRDTLFYNLGQVRVQSYRLEFIPNQLAQPGLEAFLEDRFLHTSTAVSLQSTTNISFNVINTAGSYAPDRFRLVFRSKKAPVKNSLVNAHDVTGKGFEIVNQKQSKFGNGTSVNWMLPRIVVFPNPVLNKNVQVQFINKTPGKYNVAISNKLGDIVFNDNVMIGTNETTNRSFQLSSSLAPGVYQVTITGADGSSINQQIMIL